MPLKDPVARAEYHRRWRRKNADRLREAARRYRHVNREGYQAARQRYLKRQGQARAISAGAAIPIAEAREALRSKPLACEICGRTDQPLCYDHCHESGNFRGWLCRGCNGVLGRYRDDPDLLTTRAGELELQAVRFLVAADYLKERR